MPSITCLLGLLSLVPVVLSDLEFTCHAEDDNLVSVTYTGDVKAVLARRRDGVECKFIPHPGEATFTLDLKLNKTDPDDCEMERVLGKSFSIDVIIRTENALLDQASDLRRRITCGYDSFNERNVSHESEDTIYPPKMVPSQQGPKADAKISVSLRNIKGEPLTGKITLGQRVKIKAVMEPSADYAGFRVTSCSVETDDGSIKIVIFANGCGTGSPFDKTAGFTINGLEASSPIFRLFRLIKGQGIIIKCQTNMCADSCDGVSNNI